MPPAIVHIAPSPSHGSDMTPFRRLPGTPPLSCLPAPAPAFAGRPASDPFSSASAGIPAMAWHETAPESP